ncbi:MAG: ABC transporter substrate-binding protein [Longimicrobiales bacterium]
MTQRRETEGERIASMLASATEIVAALGLEDQLVAISHECDYPPGVLDRPRASRPIFEVDALSSGEIDRAVRTALLEHGSVYAVAGELLARVNPTLILTQAVCDVCAVPTAGVREVVAERHLNAHVLSLDAHTLSDILETVHAVGRAAGVPARATALVAALTARIERVRDAVEDRPRPRVLAIEWLDPVFLPGHWVPEMIEIAGGQNLAGAVGRRSVESSFNELEGLDPDVLLIMPCGYGLEASLREADAFRDSLLRIAARAVSDGNAWAVDGSSFFNRSGPRVVDGIEIVSAILHGAGKEGLNGRASKWESH